MMSRCATCGTSWTSLGMPLCPICGAKVHQPTKSLNDELRTPSGVLKAVGSTAVLSSPEAPLQAPPRLDLTIEKIMRDVPAVESEASKPTRRLYAGEPPARIPRSPIPVQHPTLDELARDLLRMPRETLGPGTPEAGDASVVLQAPPPPDADLPAPARPLNGPIILGSLALVTVILLPLTAAFESSRVFGILGFCTSGFFLPFSPIAWIVGLSAEKRRREQRLRPEKRVILGRRMGQWATLLLIAEGTIGLILVAALRLSGKLPSTFWAP